MSRKIIVTLAAALAAATLVVGTADAKKPNNGPNNGPHNGPHMNNHWNNHWVFHHHHDRFARLRYVQPVVTDVVRVATPGPCTCLTKGYTPEGMVVFKDLCTKEMASAPADGSSDQAQATPGNMAGQTYQDWKQKN
jgi:hypothetical protein